MFLLAVAVDEVMSFISVRAGEEHQRFNVAAMVFQPAGHTWHPAIDSRRSRQDLELIARINMALEEVDERPVG